MQFPILHNITFTQHFSYDYAFMMTIVLYGVITAIACLYGLWHCTKDCNKDCCKSRQSTLDTEIEQKKYRTFTPVKFQFGLL